MQPNVNFNEFNSNTTVNPNTTLNLNSEQILASIADPMADPMVNPIADQPTTHRYGFFMVDNEIIDEHGAEIGPYAFFVYSAICRYANRNGQCFPSVPTLAKVTGMCEASVRKALNTLETQKLIYRTHCFDQKGGQRSNIYTLLPIDKEPKRELGEGHYLVEPPHLNGLKQGPHEITGGGLPDRPKQNTYYSYPLEQETEKNKTRVEVSNTVVDSTLVETVVVGVETPSASPETLLDLTETENQDRFNYVLNRFAELTDNDQPNSREVIQLRKLSRYAKFIVDNAFDAALEWTTSPHKAPIRNAAAWLVGTAKRMKKNGGSPVKPRNQEPTIEAYRRFNRENGGVILGLSGSIEEGGSDEKVEVKAKVKVESKDETKTEVKAEIAQKEPTEEEKTVWAKAQEQLKEEINTITYEMAIAPLSLASVEGECYTLEAPSPGMIHFLENNGIGHVKRVFRQWLGQERATIEFKAASQPHPINPARRRYH